MSLNRFRLGRFFSIVCLVTVAAFAGCASSTVLQSQPPGARVFLNGVPVGTTPYTMIDTNISGTATQVRLEYPGFDPLNTMIVRNEELDPLALIGFFLLVPLLWIMAYQPTHLFTMQPLGGAQPPAADGWTQPPQQGGYPPAPQQGSGYPPAPPPAGYPPPPPSGYPPPAGYPPPQ